jgi:hypothetical protein
MVSIGADQTKIRRQQRIVRQLLVDKWRRGVLRASDFADLSVRIRRLAPD